MTQPPSHNQAPPPQSCENTKSPPSQHTVTQSLPPTQTPYTSPHPRTNISYGLSPINPQIQYTQNTHVSPFTPNTLQPSIPRYLPGYTPFQSKFTNQIPRTQSPYVNTRSTVGFYDEAYHLYNPRSFGPPAHWVPPMYIPESDQGYEYAYNHALPQNPHVAPQPGKFLGRRKRMEYEEPLVSGGGNSRHHHVSARDKRKPKPHFIRFEDFGMPISEVFERLVKQGLAKPLINFQPKNPERYFDVNRKCAFHNIHGHDTDECSVVKRIIRDLIAGGKLEPPRAPDTARDPNVDTLEFAESNPMAFPMVNARPKEKEPVVDRVNDPKAGEPVAGRMKNLVSKMVVPQTNIAGGSVAQKMFEGLNAPG